jgi:hypothetical protein
MSIGLNLLLEFMVVLGVIAIGFLSGSTEMHDLLCHNDIGTIIMAFGIFWIVGVVFRLNKMSETIVSVFVAFGILLFGYVLFKFGLGYALLTTGCFLFYSVIVVCQISPKTGGILFFISISLLLIGYPIRGATKPTNLRPDIYQPITDPNAKWDLELINYGKESTLTNVIKNTRIVAHFVGTEQQAYRQANELIENKGYRAHAINLLPTYISPEYTPKDTRLRQYIGLSTEDLECTYSQEDRPGWLCHPFWEFELSH